MHYSYFYLDTIPFTFWYLDLNVPIQALKHLKCANLEPVWSEHDATHRDVLLLTSSIHSVVTGERGAFHNHQKQVKSILLSTTTFN